MSDSFSSDEVVKNLDLKPGDLVLIKEKLTNGEGKNVLAVFEGEERKTLDDGKKDKFLKFRVIGTRSDSSYFIYYDWAGRRSGLHIKWLAHIEEICKLVEQKCCKFK